MSKLLYIFFVVIIISSCGGLRYLVFGPVYKGKLKKNDYPVGLDSTAYYVYEYKAKNETWYYYTKFNNNGVKTGCFNKGVQLTYSQLDSVINSQKEESRTHFTFKNGLLEWATYSDFLHGSTFYKGEIHSDSIVWWGVPNWRERFVYKKMK